MMNDPIGSIIKYCININEGVISLKPRFLKKFDGCFCWWQNTTVRTVSGIGFLA